MNALSNKFKSLPIVIGNSLQLVRNYATIKKLPITWVRPEKISCIKPEKSGDGGLEFDISDDTPINYYDQSKELENADELTKKMFAVGFNRKKELAAIRREKIIDLVRRHKQDRGSVEAKIAADTAKILQLQEHQENFPLNIKSKVFLKELIEKRKKMLKFLRMQDYRRFEFLLERLNLVYHPFPETNPYIYRKDSTKKLLNKWCDELVQNKLNAYREELEAEQKDFFKEKAEKLEFIRNEEIACGVTPTVTEEEVEAAKQKAQSFV